jgi:hypothetical protein
VLELVWLHAASTTLAGRLQGCRLVVSVDEPGQSGLWAILPVRAHTVISEVAVHALLTTYKSCGLGQAKLWLAAVA